jgi:hypothetical protein
MRSFNPSRNKNGPRSLRLTSQPPAVPVGNWRPLLYLKVQSYDTPLPCRVNNFDNGAATFEGEGQFVSEFVDMEKVNATDEILAVEVRHACNGVLDPGSSNETLNVANICEKQCGRCGGYSGFDFTRADRPQIPGEPDRPQRQLNQQILSALLPEYMQRPTAKTRDLLQVMLTAGRLQFGFKVR